MSSFDVHACTDVYGFGLLLVITNAYPMLPLKVRCLLIRGKTEDMVQIERYAQISLKSMYDFYISNTL